jgi:serine/threonine protein kinase
MLEIYGASIVDDDPFIVMPLYVNGNARAYVENNPTCNRLSFVCASVCHESRLRLTALLLDKRCCPRSHILAWERNRPWRHQRGGRTTGHLSIPSDLCPLFQKNILVDEHLTAVLCDFGIARIRDEMSTRATTTAQMAAVEGTRNWMAPERMTSSKVRTPSDIYSIGVTIFEVR